MILNGRGILTDFMKTHADSRPAIQSWVAEVEAAAWKTPTDIKNRFSSASFLPNNRVIFNIKGNNYRLEVLVSFEPGIVNVEWVGTHAEYDKRYS